MPEQPMSMEIASHKGTYHVYFHNEIRGLLDSLKVTNAVFLVDRQVMHAHKKALAPLLDQGSVVEVDACEANKSLETMPQTIATLLRVGIRRGDTIVVIGGGIVQDIGCFVASTLFRGLTWVFLPTTLLAQADSCIGSKSSINMQGYKNIVGTFNPPSQVHICNAFLDTLSEVEIRSGMGEMLKVHMLDNINALSRIVSQYEDLLSDKHVMMSFVHASLKIKKRFIEIDEFDEGIRNLLNYGHSFGHAIEGATNFRVPHGIAVTMGMDIANFIAKRTGFGTDKPFAISHDTMRKNYQGFQNEPVLSELFRASLEKDKKNIGNQLTLILPNKADVLEKTSVNKTDDFWRLCDEFFEEIRLR